MTKIQYQYATQTASCSATRGLLSESTSSSPCPFHTHPFSSLMIKQMFTHCARFSHSCSRHSPNRERIIWSLTLCKNSLYTKVSIQHCRTLLFSPASIGIMPAVCALHPDDIAVFTSSNPTAGRERESPPNHLARSSLLEQLRPSQRKPRLQSTLQNSSRLEQYSIMLRR